MPNPEKQTKEDEAELKQIDDEIEAIDAFLELLKQESTIGRRIFKELEKRPRLIQPDKLYTYVMQMMQLADDWKDVDLMTLDKFLEILDAAKDVAKFVFEGP